MDDLEILRRTERLLSAGALGVVYGRNVIQHPNPSAMLRALSALVHENATSDQAATLLGEVRTF